MWIKLMGSWLSRLVGPCVLTVLTGSLDSDVLQGSCCGGFDCSVASNAFCSWFSFP